MSDTYSPGRRRRRGFERAGSLVTRQVRGASESRGFAESRLLTHWAEIVGGDIARIARPISVSYGRGFGATLTVLTTGAQAPMLQMQAPALRDKINACYGYNAISRLRFTQTAPTGFAEGQIAFTPAPKATKRPDPAITEQAERLAGGVQDDGLRRALSDLAENILTTSKQTESPE